MLRCRIHFQACVGIDSDYQALGATFSTQSTRVATPDSLNVRLEQAAFLDAVTGPNLRSEDLTISCKWYTIFLRCKIEEAWVPLFQPVLIGICCWDRTPCESCIELAFACLKTVVSVFRKRDLALVEISDELYNKGLLREDSADDDRSNAKQLVFAAFGWISKLLFHLSTTRRSMLIRFELCRSSIYPGIKTGESVPSNR